MQQSLSSVCFRLMSLPKSFQFVLQPHPASEAAAATVVASGAQTTIKLPRAIADDDLTDGADTYVDSWQDEPLSPETTVYGAAPPPPLARQQTFGRVSALCSHDVPGIHMAMLYWCMLQLVLLTAVSQQSNSTEDLFAWRDGLCLCIFRQLASWPPVRCCMQLLHVTLLQYSKNQHRLQAQMTCKSPKVIARMLHCRCLGLTMCQPWKLSQQLLEWLTGQLGLMGSAALVPKQAMGLQQSPVLLSVP